MTYVVGVSSGIFGAAPQEEKAQYAGLYKKAQYCITKGVEFVQIDLESISEFKDPDLKQKMESIKKLGISFGIHSEVAAFGGREFPHMDSAIDIDYERGHKRMAEVLEETGKLGSKFVLTHSSESTPFLLLGQHLQPSALVDVWGRDFSVFLDENPGLAEWAIKEENDFIREIFLHGLINIDDQVDDAVKRTIRNRKEEIEIWNRQGRTMSEESQKEYLNQPETEEYRKRIREDIKDSIKREFKNFTRSRSLSYGPERLAYYITAKWMENENDKLWNEIIDASVQYYSQIDNKTPEEWLKEKGIDKLNGKWSIDMPKLRLEYRLWVPAVSAKYVWGHMMQDKCPSKTKYDDLKKIIKKYNMPLLLESPMASPGLEENLRLPNPLQMFPLIKDIGTEYIQLAIDIEHMLMSNQNPEKSFNLLPEDGGSFVRVIHAGWPAVLGPAHIPIPLGSDQQVYLYKMYYLLRQKGFGKDKSDYYLIFERGGGADPIQQSIIALRKIKEFLEKDIKPKDLHKYPDFFGLDIGEIGSMQRQLATIHEHGRDPLKGMIVIPEEEYGFLGRAASEKGKAEIWKKEELR